MEIKQWEDKNLAHFSYAVLDDNKIVLIDPARNPQPYLDYAKERGAEIIGIIETHPHADFVSCHLELHQITGATIYASGLIGAAYPHHALNEGTDINFGGTRLHALHTPGHSPDSMTIVAFHGGKQKAVFSGDTLFIGDCGRPDLREGAGHIKVNRNDLAKSMYHSLRNKYLALDDDAILYPAHGAGTLCGKSLSKSNSSTIGHEKQSNWSLQTMSEDSFVEKLLSDQPFVPAYFSHDVDLNRRGAAAFVPSINNVDVLPPVKNEQDAGKLNSDIWIIDARPDAAFKQGHLPRSINLMEGTKFETWLGSIIKPGETFYLACQNARQIEKLIARAAAIGYETQIQAAFVLEYSKEKEKTLDVEKFRGHEGAYTIVDVRNSSEVKEEKIFKNSLAIPLADLRDRVDEIPTDRPIIVHCAGGYRSAAASSILQALLRREVPVFDLGEAVKDFQ